jgi:hypothetical protein
MMSETEIALQGMFETLCHPCGSSDAFGAGFATAGEGAAGTGVTSANTRAKS